MDGVLRRLKQNWIRMSLSAVVMIVFLVHASELYRLGFVERLENIAYDTHLSWTLPGTQGEKVVIIDIDERSLTAEGRWPWPRAKLARMLERLFEEYEASIVGFDIVFAEADDSSGLKVLEDLAGDEFSALPAFRERLEEIRPELDYDTLFAQSVARYPVVLGYYFNLGVGSEQETARIGALPEPVLGKSVFRGKNIRFLVADGYGSNLEALNTNALGAGHFSQAPDPDGVVRRVPMLIKYEDGYYASLALEVIRQVLGGKPVEPVFVDSPFDTRGYPGLEWLRVGRARIPVDAGGRSLVPYRGRQGSFAYVSATDVLNGTADDSALRNKIVLVGTSAPGLLDLRTVPVQEAYPGVEVHANLISGILNGTVMQAPAYTVGAEFVLLVVIGIGMILAGALLNPLNTTIFAVIGILAFLGFNQLIWSMGIVLPVASGILMVLIMFLLNMSYGYFVETRGKRQITGLFGQYVPPELVDEMAKAPTNYSLEAESRELTVLFSDVRGFTTLSEGLSPGDLADLMNQFLTPMTGIIHDNRGTIDKYMGDAIMAFWGAPLDDPSHARHALEAGMEMIDRLESINTEFNKRGWPAVRIGVGINTGLMNVGNMGSSFRMAYTVLGDAVNLGSRLEGLTKNYGVNVICSETTVAAVPDYAYRELDRVRVKGKAKPVAIFEPLCKREALDGSWKKELKLYAETLRLYRAQEWDMAELNFMNLIKSSRSSALYEIYIERIKHFRHEPPARDWDGVFDHKTK